MRITLCAPYRRRDLIGATITWALPGERRGHGTVAGIDDNGGLAIFVAEVDAVIYGRPPRLVIEIE